MSIADLYRGKGRTASPLRGGGIGSLYRKSHTGSLAALLDGVGGASVGDKSGAAAGSAASPAPKEDDADAKLRKAQKTLEGHLKKILDSDAPPTEKKDAKKKAKGGSSNPLMKVLSALDLPRAVVVSAFKEGVVDRTRSALDRAGVLDKEPGETASWGDFRRQVGEHIGYGDIIDKDLIPVAAQITDTDPEELKKNSVVKWTARIGGLAGDVIGDPLSYLAPEAKLAQLSKPALARKILTEGTEKLGKEGAERAAAKVLQKGASSLTTDELRAVGLKGGLYFNAPGTGRVGRALGRVVGKDIKPAQAQLLKHGGATSALPRVLGELGVSARSGRVGVWLSDNLAGAQAELKAAARSGDPTVAVPALHALDELNKGRLAKASFGAIHGSEMSKLLKDAKRAGVSGEDLFHAAAGDPDAAARIGEDLTSRTRQLFDGLQAEANRVAGEDFIAKREHYAPRFRTAEARETVGATKGGKPFGRASIEKAAGLRPGEEFLGQVLREPGTVVDGAVSPSVEKQVDTIAKSVLGDKAVHLFEDDAFTAFPAYLRVISKRVGEKVTERGLRAKGVIREVSVPGSDLKPSQRLQREAEELAHAEAAASSRAAEARRAYEQHAASLPGADIDTAAARAQRRLTESLGAKADEADRFAEDVARQVSDRASALDAQRARVAHAVSNESPLYERYTELHDQLTYLREQPVTGALRKEAAAIEKELRQLEQVPELRGALRRGYAEARARVEAGDSSYLDELELHGDALRRLGIDPEAAVRRPEDIAADIERMAPEVERLAQLHDGARKLLARSVLSEGDDAAEAAAEARRLLDESGVEQLADLKTHADEAATQLRGLEDELAEVELGRTAVGGTASTQGASTAVPWAEPIETIASQADVAHADPALAVEANERRMREVHEEALSGELSARKRARLADELDLRERSDAAWKQAQQAADSGAPADAVLVQHLEAVALGAEADLSRANRGRLTVEDAAAALRGREQELTDALADGLRQWGFGPDGQLRMAPEQIVEALQDVQKVATPEGIAGFLRFYDKVLGLWKAYAVFSPGFHARNYMGGMFNNYLAGVELGAHRRFAKAYVAFKRGGVDAIKDAKVRSAFAQLDEAGMLAEGGNIAHELDIVTTGKLNPLSRGFAPLRGSRKVGEQVEIVLRNTLAVDTLLKGGTIDDAIDAVYKFHFNYEDLSRFERTTARRVIPFYTWTRRNLPLQLEQLVRQPNKYKRYLDVKRNVELGTDEESVVPSYFDEQLGVRLPFGKNDGSRAYSLPDLPFADLTMDSPRDVIAGASPFLKTPFEVWSGKQVFADLPIFPGKEIAPHAWTVIPGLMPALAAMGKAQKDKSGRWIISNSTAYAVGSFVPPLQRARTLFPSEPRYERRRTTTMLSFIFGAGVRTNDLAGQASELKRRDRQLSSVIADLKDRGYLESRSAS